MDALTNAQIFALCWASAFTVGGLIFETIRFCVGWDKL